MLIVSLETFLFIEVNFSKRLKAVAASGNHEELLKKSALYKNFYDKQITKK